MENAPDRAATEQVVLNLGWKCALGLPLEYKGFHATTLVVFRKRLVEAGLERVAFDAVVDVLGQEKWLKKGRKQRLDSTHIVGCVARMGSLELVRETLRLALEAIQRCGRAGSVPGWELLQERYCEGTVDWRKQDKAKLTKKLQQAGEDAHEILRWWEQQDSALPERAQERLELLQRVCAEQFEWEQDGLQPRRHKGSGTVQNPHDPDAQWSSKDAKGTSAWVGYKAQLTETVPEEPGPKQKGEPTEEFLTQVSTTEAIASDMDGMQRALDAQQEQGQSPPSELFADAGYVTDDTLHEAQESGTELVGPARPSPQHQGVFPSERFEVDNANRKAICAADKASTRCSRISDAHKGNEYYRYEWGSQCDECPLQSECTRAKSGRRILKVGIHHDLLQARRREMETDEFVERMKQRNAIEGTISRRILRILTQARLWVRPGPVQRSGQSHVGQLFHRRRVQREALAEAQPVGDGRGGHGGRGVRDAARGRMRLHAPAPWPHRLPLAARADHVHLAVSTRRTDGPIHPANLRRPLSSLGLPPTIRAPESRAFFSGIL
jgi:hypothetical protein